MFRNMRRDEKLMTLDETQEVLREQDFGILSVIGDDGYPYGVPVNYVYDEGKLYFHGTSEASHKLDAINKEAKVSFTVVSQHELVPEKMSTKYASVIIFGRARVIYSKEETIDTLRTFLARLSPEMASKTSKIYEAKQGKFVMIEITPEHTTGKKGN